MGIVTTSNYKVAAYAVALGHPIKQTSRAGQKVSFCFMDTDQLRTDLDDYRFSNPDIPVHDYEAARARLNTLIHDRPWGND